VAASLGADGGSPGFRLSHSSIRIAELGTGQPPRRGSECGPKTEGRVEPGSCVRNRRARRIGERHVRRSSSSPAAGRITSSGLIRRVADLRFGRRRAARVPRDGHRESGAATRRRCRSSCPDLARIQARCSGCYGEIAGDAAEACRQIVPRARRSAAASSCCAAVPRVTGLAVDLPWLASQLTRSSPGSAIRSRTNGTRISLISTNTRGALSVVTSWQPVDPRLQAGVAYFSRAG